MTRKPQELLIGSQGDMMSPIALPLYKDLCNGLRIDGEDIAGQWQWGRVVFCLQLNIQL